MKFMDIINQTPSRIYRASLRDMALLRQQLILVRVVIKMGILEAFPRLVEAEPGLEWHASFLVFVLSFLPAAVVEV